VLWYRNKKGVLLHPQQIMVVQVEVAVPAVGIKPVQIFLLRQRLK
jgi:hypothetical protein